MYFLLVFYTCICDFFPVTLFPVTFFRDFFFRDFFPVTFFPSTGVFMGIPIFSYFLLQNIECGYSLELLGEVVLTCTHNLCFQQKKKKRKI